MAVPHTVDGSREAIVLVKSQYTYTADVGIKLVSVSVEFVYILAHCIMLTF